MKSRKLVTSRQLALMASKSCVLVNWQPRHQQEEEAAGEEASTGGADTEPNTRHMSRPNVAVAQAIRWRFTRRVGAQFLIKPRHARGFFHWLYIGRQTLAFWHHEGRTPTDGNAVTRQATMAALAKSWRRERLQIDVACGAGESNLPIKTI